MAGVRPAHLQRRGAVYCVRFRIPTNLVPALGIVEICRSLHTRDPNLAKRRCLQATIWFRNAIEILNRMTAPTRHDLEQSARNFFDEMVRANDVPRHFNDHHFADEVAMNIEASNKRIAALDLQLINNIFDEVVKSRARIIAADAGMPLDKLPQEQRLYAEMLAARSEREQLEMLKHMLTQPIQPFFANDALFTVSSGLSLSTPVHSALAIDTGPRLDHLVAAYMASLKARNLGYSHRDEVERALGWFKERVGPDRDINSITKAEARTFREDISRMDAGMRGKGLPFDQRLTSIAKNQIKSATAVKYWRSVQAFFAWAEAEHDEVAHDPTHGLTLKAKKGQKRQSPEAFSMEELKRLFQTPLYAGYLSVRRRGHPGTCMKREGHWWAGVLMLWTGLRAGELSQLLPADFIIAADIPHLKVRREDEAGNEVKQTKNQASVRDIPLAPILFDLGLAEFVAVRAKRYPKDRLFREFRLGSKDRVSDGMTKFWSDYLKKFDLWKPGRATHVWRHTVVACLRANGVSDEDIGAFVGHKLGTMTSEYGGDHPLSRKAGTVQRLDYGFDVLAALGGSWDKVKHG